MEYLPSIFDIGYSVFDIRFLFRYKTIDLAHRPKSLSRLDWTLAASGPAEPRIRQRLQAFNSGVHKGSVSLQFRFIPISY